MNQITLEEQIAEEMNQLFGGTAEQQTEEQILCEQYRELDCEIMPAAQRIANRELDKIKACLGVGEEEYLRHSDTFQFEFPESDFSDQLRPVPPHESRWGCVYFYKESKGSLLPYNLCVVEGTLSAWRPKVQNGERKGKYWCAKIEIEYRFETKDDRPTKITRTKNLFYDDIWAEEERHKQQQLDKL